MKNFFSKYDQIRNKLRIWSHLLKKSFMENFFFVQCLKVLVKDSLKVFKLKAAVQNHWSTWYNL